MIEAQTCNNEFEIVTLQSKFFKDNINYLKEIENYIKAINDDEIQKNKSMIKDALCVASELMNKTDIDKDFVPKILQIDNDDYDAENKINKINNYIETIINIRQTQCMKYDDFIKKCIHFDYWKIFIDKIIIDFSDFENVNNGEKTPYPVFFQFITTKICLYIIDNYIKTYKESLEPFDYLSNINNENVDKSYYAEKINITNNKSNIYFFGDIHSSLYAIVQFIEDLKKKDVFIMESNELFNIKKDMHTLF